MSDKALQGWAGTVCGVCGRVRGYTNECCTVRMRSIRERADTECWRLGYERLKAPPALAQPPAAPVQPPVDGVREALVALRALFQWDGTSGTVIYRWAEDGGPDLKTALSIANAALGAPRALTSAPPSTPPVVVGQTGREHDLKLRATYFGDVAVGAKNFEIRLNDRDYRVGDVLRLREWLTESEQYTGREVRRLVTYVLRDSHFVSPGHVGLALATLPPVPAPPQAPTPTNFGASSPKEVSCSGPVSESGSSSESSLALADSTDSSGSQAATSDEKKGDEREAAEVARDRSARKEGNARGGAAGSTVGNPKSEAPIEGQARARELREELEHRWKLVAPLVAAARAYRRAGYGLDGATERDAQARANELLRAAEIMVPPEDAPPTPTVQADTRDQGEALRAAHQRCPTCDSPNPKLHPAMQSEGEVQVCRSSWHSPLLDDAGKPPTPAPPKASPPDDGRCGDLITSRSIPHVEWVCALPAGHEEEHRDHGGAAWTDATHYPRTADSRRDAPPPAPPKGEDRG